LNPREGETLMAKFFSNVTLHPVCAPQRFNNSGAFAAPVRNACAFLVAPFKKEA